MAYFAIIKQKITPLAESKGLWQQEFLIVFHFKISSLFNQKIWGKLYFGFYYQRLGFSPYHARIGIIFWVTSAYIQFHKPTKVMGSLKWNLRKFRKIASKKMSDVKNWKINSHLSPVTSNKLLNIIPTRVLSIYNGLHFTCHRCSFLSFSARKSRS